jgi:hypothetical protein
MSNSLLTPLTDEQCLEECLNDDLGPAIVVLTPYCRENCADICIPCNDQRNDMSLEASRTFTDIQTQCSQRANKRESGKSMMLNISLGRGAKRMELLAAIFDTEVKTDPTDPNCEIVEVRDEPGKCPEHFQVTILPLDGEAVDTTFGVVLEFAITHTEQFSFVFSPTTVREVQFSLEAEIHPTTQRLGYFIKSTDGNPCASLQKIAEACELKVAA